MTGNRNKSTRPPHILLGWELGGGLGHLSRIAAIAGRLISQGFRVSLCLPEPASASGFVGHLPVTVYQTPLWRRRLKTAHGPVCFADILLHRGYGSAAGLHALTVAWQNLFESLRPDLLILDYAPTALLAARGWTVPKILISSGFGERSPGLPDLCLRPWLAAAAERTRRSEAQVVGVINQVLDKRRAPPVRYVADLYLADQLFLFMIPEIDLEPHRTAATYLAPPLESGNSPLATWAKGQGPKVFAYLKPQSSLCLPVMRSIAECDCVGLIVCLGLPSASRALFIRPGLSIFTETMEVTEAIAGADVVVCHAGKNTISNALLAGKPLLMIPEQLEQFHNALRVEQHGAGILLQKGAGPARCSNALRQLITQTSFREAARIVAASNMELGQQNSVYKVVECCQRLLG